VDTIDVQLSEMQLRRARPYGNCWLGCELWLQLGLDRFWERKLPCQRRLNIPQFPPVEISPLSPVEISPGAERL
jgi:hypothetical protein